MREKHATPDLIVAMTAARQYGVVTTAQLADAGFDKSAVTRRCNLGRLHRIHRGVYAVGHSRLSNEGRWLAATLSCGEGAALSHASAAAHLGLLEPSAGPVHVTVPGSGGREKRASLRIHRSSLPQSSIVRRAGIEVTTPARTLADLRRASDPGLLRRAIRRAEVLGYDLGNATPDGTRSELEGMFLRLCRRHRLPPPEVSVPIGPFLADFVWPDARMVVETDGWRYHRGREAFESDRDRQLALEQRGYRVLRFSHRQVVERPAEIARVVRTALMAGSSR